MKIIKRSGVEDSFDISKILRAVNKANREVEETDRLTAEQIRVIGAKVEDQCRSSGRALSGSATTFPTAPPSRSNPDQSMPK